MRYHRALVGPVLVALSLAACGPKTKLVSSWTSPSLRQGAVKKVFVLGVAADGSVRRLYEDSFVQSLEKMKYAAVPGYVWIQDPKSVDKDAVEKKLREEGVTHVLATRVVDRKTIETYVPPTVVTTGVAGPGYYGSWYGYWSVGYTTVAAPGYVSRDEVYSLETNLWDVSTGERVWTGRSETWLGESPASNIKAVISTIAYELRAKKIL